MYYGFKYFDEFMVPLYESMLEFSTIKDRRDFFRIMELYSFTEPGKVRDAISEEGFDCTYLEDEFWVNSEVNSKVRNFGCFVYNYSNSVLQVVADIEMDESDKTRLLLAFPTYEVIIKYISPLNYDILTTSKQEQLRSVDGKIYFYRILLEVLRLKGSDLHMLNSSTKDSVYNYYFAMRKGNTMVNLDMFYLDRQLSDKVINSVIDNSSAETTDLDAFSGVSTTAYNVMNLGINLRIQTLKSIGGQTLTIRIQTSSTTSFEIHELGFDNRTSSLLKRLSNKENGFSIVTGPVRSGKNTTIFAVINGMLHKPIKIMDFSSPVETVMPFLQFDYKNDEKILSSYIKAAKKYDSDIITINELPNKDIAKATFDLVNSSIGVFTTLHLDRIWHLPYKLYEYYGDDYLNIIPQLNAVVNQRAFVRQCMHCLGGNTLVTQGDFDPKIHEFLERYKINSYKVSTGCVHCKGTGLQSGIRPLAEYIEFTKEVKSDLLGCASLREMEIYIENYVNKNNLSLDQQVVSHLQTGELQPRDILRIL